MSRRSDPTWRDHAARELVLKHLQPREGGRALILLDASADLARGVGEAGFDDVVRWSRYWSTGLEGDAWPAAGPFDAVFLRLPKAKEELKMWLAVAADRVDEDGYVWVYGAKDEGAGSVAPLMGAVFDRVETVATGGRCRVVSGSHGTAGGFEAEEWRLEFELLGRPWSSWPGCFAHGRLDEGTALLLEHLPEVPPAGKVLDFAAGTGVLGAALAARAPDMGLTLLDHDVLSLDAAGRNVLGAELIHGDGLGALEGRRFDVIVANPPYHDGKASTTSVLHELCESAAGLLEAAGVLRFVVQKTHAVGPLLTPRFGRVEVVAEAGGFRVWEAAEPR